MLRTIVKGTYFRGTEIQAVSDSLNEGAALEVRREADNKHDEYACSVHFQDLHIGYIQAEDAGAVSYYLDDFEGVTALPASVAGREDRYLVIDVKVPNV